MSKRIKDPFGTSFPNGIEVSDEYAVVDPHPEPPPAPAAAPTLTAKGAAWLDAYWQFKVNAKCPRCGERRFQNLADIGAGYGPPGCQIGICGPCGADLKLSRPKRRRLSTWEGA